MENKGGGLDQKNKMWATTDNPWSEENNSKRKTEKKNEKTRKKKT